MLPPPTGTRAHQVSMHDQTSDMHACVKKSQGSIRCCHLQPAPVRTSSHQVSMHDQTSDMHSCVKKSQGSIRCCPLQPAPVRTRSACMTKLRTCMLVSRKVRGRSD